MNLFWHAKGNIGYGDMMLPLCFAQNQGEVAEDIVYLEARWESKSGEGSVAFEMFEDIYTALPFPNVVLLHSFNQPPDSKIDCNIALKRTEYLHPFHTVYLPFQQTERIYDVVCSPINNSVPFTEYKFGKAEWKQYMPNEEWQKLIDKPNTIHIDYRTPTKEAIDILKKCRYFTGYHGSCSWLAKLVGVPMNILSSSPNFAKYCFPWSSGNYERSCMLLEKARIHRKRIIKRGW